jgi:hypothetical protein
VGLNSRTANSWQIPTIQKMYFLFTFFLEPGGLLTYFIYFVLVLCFISARGIKKSLLRLLHQKIQCRFSCVYFLVAFLGVSLQCKPPHAQPPLYIALILYRTGPGHRWGSGEWVLQARTKGHRVRGTASRASSPRPQLPPMPAIALILYIYIKMKTHRLISSRKNTCSGPVL